MTSRKKTAKKVVAKRVTFNKQNTLTFADRIFSDKGGVVTMTKLCEGDLAKGKDGGRQLHCAVGEAYFHFVSTNLRSVLNAKPSKEDKEEGQFEYQPKFSESEGPTGAAIDALVEVAQLKKPTETNKRKLGLALDEAVCMNDNGVCKTDLIDYLDRAQSVANVFRKQVAPLLK